MKQYLLGLVFTTLSLPSLADIVQYRDTLYVVNPANGKASEIEPPHSGTTMSAVSSFIVKIETDRYSYLFSVNPETGKRTRIDLDRYAPEAGLVKVIK